MAIWPENNLIVTGCDKEIKLWDMSSVSLV